MQLLLLEHAASSEERRRQVRNGRVEERDCSPSEDSHRHSAPESDARWKLPAGFQLRTHTLASSTSGCLSIEFKKKNVLTFLRRVFIAHFGTQGADNWHFAVAFVFTLFTFFHRRAWSARIQASKGEVSVSPARQVQSSSRKTAEQRLAVTRPSEMHPPIVVLSSCLQQYLMLSHAEEPARMIWKHNVGLYRKTNRGPQRSLPIRLTSSRRS